MTLLMNEILKGHSVTWKHDGPDIRGIIRCDNSTTDYCHMCDECCAHPDSQGVHEECLIAQDIMNTGMLMLYCGMSTDVRIGKIEIAWDGADWVWWYEGDDHADLSPKAIIQINDVLSDLSVVDETVGP